MNKPQREMIKATENHLRAKYGIAFDKMDKEKQHSLIVETLNKALKEMKARE